MTDCSDGQRLRRLARRLAGGSNDPALGPEDLLQEARIVVWQRRAAIAASANPRASVYLVARQAMVSELRRSRRARAGSAWPEGEQAGDGRVVEGRGAKEDGADGQQ
jgi:DNA-directed RNA polymerase specialized sigma24 family protein